MEEEEEEEEGLELPNAASLQGSQVQKCRSRRITPWAMGWRGTGRAAEEALSRENQPIERK